MKWTAPRISRPDKSRILNSRSAFIALAACALLTIATNSAFMAPPAANTGAIFTTDVTCSGTNVNIFANKDAVYLDGGPDGSDDVPAPC